MIPASRHQLFGPGVINLFYRKCKCAKHVGTRNINYKTLDKFECTTHHTSWYQYRQTDNTQ